MHLFEAVIDANRRAVVVDVSVDLKQSLKTL